MAIWIINTTLIQSKLRIKSRWMSIGTLLLTSLASHRIMGIFKEEFPDFERASIDEAYIDVTDKVLEMMESECHSELQPTVQWGDIANMIVLL